MSSNIQVPVSVDQPIRVAQVIGKMVGGGVESVVMNYYRHIDRTRVQYDFLVDSDSTRIPEEEITSLGGRVFKIPPYQHPLQYRRALIQLFLEYHWKIVHSHVNTLSVFPLSAAKEAGIPIRIAHSHSTTGKGEPIKNIMKLALRPFANVYPTERFACSNYAGEWLFGDKDYVVIPNAIPLDRFRFDPQTRQRIREGLNIAPDTLLIGHIGRFMPQKNQRFLVDVLADLLQRHVKAQLAFVGEGPDMGSVKMYAGTMGVQDHVMFLGQHSDVCKYYWAFDVFCLPSQYEGLCLVGIEAQRAGLPCIFSSPVTDEVNVTGTAQFLPINSPQKWVEALEHHAPGKRIPTDDEAFHDYDIVKQGQLLTQRYIDLYNRINK
ncbi:glycosyltransferase family 1 protein [Bifidobacterium mongoliense]|uniref:glycosyltransferase family 1 protein n=1 Tax=Bifidobacterium mongoliense TaxID=518643 RepID=UPI0030EB138A